MSRTQEVEHLQRLGKGEAETGGGRRRLEKGGGDWKREAETGKGRRRLCREAEEGFWWTHRLHFYSRRNL